MKKIFTFTLFVVAIAICSVRSFAQSRDEILKDIKARRAELGELEKKFLAPSDEDRASYSEFLKQPDTGLIRLLPREVYDKTGQEALTMRGGGSYYSFVRLTHEYGYGSDISLEQGQFSVGFAGADYGMLAKLEDVRLDELSASHPSVRAIVSYVPVTEEPEARLEYRRFQGEGAAFDGLVYKSRQPVSVGATYVLRSISYDRTDVLVAFQVVRKDTDGSVVIAWKLLKKFSAPKLARSNLNLN